MKCAFQQIRRCHRHRGYVLVMVLALLVISTTLLVAVSRVAGRGALAARFAQEDLQRRWGVASSRKAILPYIEQILTALEQERHRPASNYTLTVKLGSQTFELILADEQAKANVNAILEASDQTRAETRLRQSLSGTGLNNRIKLRPTVGPVIEMIDHPEATTKPTPATAPSNASNISHPQTLTVGAWGQVFDGVAPAQLIRPSPGSRRAPLDILTCWGNGAVNVRRTTDSAMTLAAGSSVNGVLIGQLIDARDALFSNRAQDIFLGQSPADKLKDLMTKAAGASLAAKGNFGLVEGSKCHSLWIITRTGRRDGYDLFVSDETKDSRPMVWSYSW